MRSALAPFRVRSFRFQWPADLATSWAFEMEMLILGWYILTATGSVEQLVVFGALGWVGTLFSPFIGIAGDRLGLRALLCVLRGAYALIAATLAVLTLAGALAPWHVFVLGALAGLLRPSDMGLRNVLVGQTVHPSLLMGALGISRTTSDTARVAGALTGTAGVALVGMGPAYVAVTALYVGAFALTLQVGGAPPRAEGNAARAAAQALVHVQQAFRYVWDRNDLLGALSMAFLVNLLAFPFTLGLLPYAAKDVFAIGQSGLGWLAAAFAAGALVGSLMVGARRAPLAAGRVMLWSAAGWFAAVLLFGQTRSLGFALVLLFGAGLLQSFCMTPLAAVLLRGSSEEMRNRVMGIRILAIWGLPLGLLAAGPIIAHLGYAATTFLYSSLGLAATFAIGRRWRGELWHRAAPANSPG